MSKKFVFITDLHITSVCNVRTGDVLADICSKLEDVVAYANKEKASIVIGGDIFDKPTVPDFVKGAAARVFRKAKKPIYTINGNHDTLYNNSEFDYRTSYNLFVDMGLFEDFTGTTLDLGDCRLTSKLPLATSGKPTLCVYHGFWNIEDGKWSCKTSDVVTEDETVVLLGHDHVVYSEEEPYPNVKVVRPGSLLRGIRIDEHNRIPVMTVVELTDEGKWIVSYKNIKCRAASEIFEAKQFSLSNTEVRDSYSEVIERLKNAQTGEMTLEDALKQVTQQEVIDYINLVLGE